MPADLAVIGLGHLGLPLARAAVTAGIDTVGYDPDPRPYAELRAGRSPVEGTLTASEIRRMLSGGFRPTTDAAELGRVRTAVICSPTPLGPDGGPTSPRSATPPARWRPGCARTPPCCWSPPCRPAPRRTSCAPCWRRAPGSSPDGTSTSPARRSRLDPGNRTHTLANTPKVIGGLTPACTESAAAFYGRLTDKVVRARGPREAEMTKVLETNFRHVNIALVNEMAVLCHDLGVDFWDVIRCAETKPFGFQPFRPGPGVGGHGAPVDPGCLPHSPRSPGNPLRMVSLAQEINDRMPSYVIQRCATLLNEHGKSVRGARVLLLGVTYKPDSADQEAAPAREIATRLMDMGAQIGFHDPHVLDWRVRERPVPRADSLYEAAAAADLTVLLQQHRTYDLQGLAVKAQLLLDTRGATPAGAAHRL